jgi:exosortase
MASGLPRIGEWRRSVDAPPRRDGLPWILPAAVATGLVVVYLPVFAHAVTVWRWDQELSFGFLVPPIVLGLLWLRRSSAHAALAMGSNPALLVLAGGLLLLLAGSRTGLHALAGASFLPTVLGAVAYLYGTAVARTALFPVALQTVSLCLYRGLLDDLGFALQGLTARAAASLTAFLGVPVRQVGVDLFVGDHHFVVAQSCSGMDSLLALLCLGLLFAGLAQAAWWRRATLLVLVLPIVVSVNVVRVTLVLALAPSHGTALAAGVGHQVLDAGLFGGAAVLYYLTAIGLRCPPRFAATRSSSC